MATLSSAMAIAGLIGGGLKAYGQYQSGQDAKSAYDVNALISEQEANLIRKGADLDEYRSRKHLRAVTGQQTAAYGSSGVELTGSPLDVMQDTIANAELEISINRFNAENVAKGKISEAGRSRDYGKQESRSATTRATSTLLSTAGDYASKYYVPKKKKIGA